MRVLFLRRHDRSEVRRGRHGIVYNENSGHLCRLPCRPCLRVRVLRATSAFTTHPARSMPRRVRSARKTRSAPRLRCGGRCGTNAAVCAPRRCRRKDAYMRVLARSCAVEVAWCGGRGVCCENDVPCVLFLQAWLRSRGVVCGMPATCFRFYRQMRARQPRITPLLSEPRAAYGMRCSRLNTVILMPAMPFISRAPPAF